MVNRRRKTLAITMTPGVLERLDSYVAGQAGQGPGRVSRSSTIEQAVTEFLVKWLLTNGPSRTEVE
jgi:hypothetical protein